MTVISGHPRLGTAPHLACPDRLGIGHLLPRPKRSAPAISAPFRHQAGATAWPHCLEAERHPP